MSIHIETERSSVESFLRTGSRESPSVKALHDRRRQSATNLTRKAVRYGYLGPEATFTEAALRTLPGVDEAECISFPTVAAALGAVRNGSIDAAMAPLENSIEGGVPATMAEFLSSDPLHIVAEVQLKVEFALMARRGVRLNDIRKVTSHPHALGQCREWLLQTLPAAEQENASSTANAARELAERRDQDAAAIAAPIAAHRYGLEILASDIGQRKDAVTRFVLLRRPGPPPPRSGRDRTSIHAMADHDRPEWLRHVLEAFADRGVPVTRIDPRPSGAGFGRYHFLVDCEGHVSDPQVEDALNGMQEHGVTVRFLGSYPRGS